MDTESLLSEIYDIIYNTVYGILNTEPSPYTPVPTQISNGNIKYEIYSHNPNYLLKSAYRVTENYIIPQHMVEIGEKHYVKTNLSRNVDHRNDPVFLVTLLFAQRLHKVSTDINEILTEINNYMITFYNIISCIQIGDKRSMYLKSFYFSVPIGNGMFFSLTSGAVHDETSTYSEQYPVPTCSYTMLMLMRCILMETLDIEKAQTIVKDAVAHVANDMENIKSGNFTVL